MKKPTPQMTLDEAKKVRVVFVIIALTALVIILIGTFMMRYLEGLSYLDAAYFSVVALTTVGFGDISPETTGGKLFVMGYLLVGIAILAAFVNNLLRYAMARRVLNNAETKEKS